MDTPRFDARVAAQDLFDACVAAHDLNEHPFYRAWRAGTLPAEALARYAAEYAPFIAAVETGWRTLGEDGHAAVEREHAQLWQRFRDALGAGGVPSCPEAAHLARQACRDFEHPATAIGALYAFEAQQPSTSRSKLQGLREHYAVTGEAARYFERHADDYGERERLRALASSRLDADGAARAAQACERTCRGMWDALTGIMAAHAEC